jgi:hypothetical protein
VSRNIMRVNGVDLSVDTTGDRRDPPFDRASQATTLGDRFRSLYLRFGSPGRPTRGFG